MHLEKAKSIYRRTLDHQKKGDDGRGPLPAKKDTETLTKGGWGKNARGHRLEIPQSR